MGYWLGVVETLSIQEAAELLGVTASAVLQRVSSGSLPGRRVDRDWRLLRPASKRLVTPRD
ncbi:helix-turn-helix domain-containing protein [Actinotalea sp. Marseille-Q4924]|uniref:helix-turn-helix domain-containing protein n=1 Tax=Actinotalea sp. Marseille-Q4924 TaxID=2866571 RepID=UPI001CE4AA87|nr:helix-turn-helix domain-containing protein [Actinotalea sp. Marseille-Q4924]